MDSVLRFDSNNANLVLWARSENMGSATKKKIKENKGISYCSLVETGMQWDPCASVGMTRNENRSSPMGLKQSLVLVAWIFYCSD